MTRGIIIVCDDKYLVDLRHLVASVRAVCDLPLVVYPFGCGPTERREIDALGVDVRPFPPAYQERWRGVYDRSHCWQKPWLIRESPFDATLYLDPDLLVLCDPSALLDRAEAVGFTVFPQRGDSATCCGNAPQLAALAPQTSPGVEVPVQAGVIATCRACPRDGLILAAWCSLIERALVDPPLARALTFGDQGGLAWTLAQLHAQDAIVGEVAGHCWNVSANGLWEQPRAQRRRYRDDATLLDRVRADHPGAGIVHWYGAPKLRELLDR